MKTEEALRQDMELLGLVINHLNKIAFLIKERRKEASTTIEGHRLLNRCSTIRASVNLHVALARHYLRNLQSYADTLKLGELSETTEE